MPKCLVSLSGMVVAVNEVALQGQRLTNSTLQFVIIVIKLYLSKSFI